MNDGFQTNKCDLSFLTAVPGDWHHACFDIYIGQDHSNPVTVFCCQTATLHDLEANWTEINGTIATDYIADIENSFERWNTYLLFVCSEVTPPALQYEIENNKFAMRKMVEVAAGKTLSDNELAVILNEKILASKIKLTHEQLQVDAPLVFSAVTNSLLAADLSVDTKKESRDGREEWLKSELARTTDNEN